MAEKLTFQQKLLKAQSELKAPKNQYNKFGKYKYRSAEDILEGAKVVNNKYGLTLTISDSIEEWGGRVYVVATAHITDGEESLQVTAYAREAEDKKGMDSAQVTGATSSYARKYALNGLYLIDDTNDADADEHKQETTQRQKQNNQNNQQNEFGKNKQEVMKKLQLIANATGYSLDDTKRMVIEKTNESLGRNDKDIVPANISKVYGFAMSVENNLKKEGKL